MITEYSSLLVRGNYAFQKDDFKEALRKYNLSKEREIWCVELFHNMGHTKYILGDFQGALDDLNTAYRYRKLEKERIPNYRIWKLLYHRGLAKTKLGHDKDAIQDFILAEKKVPKYEAWRIAKCKGACYEKLKQYRLALRAYRRAMKVISTFYGEDCCLRQDLINAEQRCQNLI